MGLISKILNFQMLIPMCSCGINYSTLLNDLITWRSQSNIIEQNIEVLCYVSGLLIHLDIASHSIKVN